MPATTASLSDALPLYLPESEKKPAEPDGKSCDWTTRTATVVYRRIVFLGGLRLPRAVGFAAGSARGRSAAVMVVPGYGRRWRGR